MEQLQKILVRIEKEVDRMLEDLELDELDEVSIKNLREIDEIARKGELSSLPDVYEL